ncbi:hypothetical protein IWC96_15400 [Brevundimonas sp. BAL450]|uniref:Qat anti-phage system QueC-like protein QatC n=1 Tax=Brevundimonas sp. BAL450 TaxID=1708162 RepID=UPI0018CB6DA8|nr:Qat anti-phage system QueC-like protein QatC [Brevundimonas sp. BAL450]MBG7616660.1 hypothetical protein [Brevundimonas sp. BAL450]
MSAHSIVCRLGDRDRTRLPAAKGLTRTEISFIEADRRLDYGLGQALDQLAGVGLRPGEIAVDLAIFAATLTAADTRVNRHSEAQDGWTREITPETPVSDPALWASVSDLLVQMLNFLTGDRWSLRFRARAPGLKRLAPAPLRLPLHRPKDVCLFSGGLDSYIGAIDLLEKKRSSLLVSHYWDGVTSAHQSLCADRLEKAYPKSDLIHLRARVGFPTGAVPTSSGENSLRGRSFLFFALAALAADAIDDDVTIHVPENGLISLNVPLDPLRLGSLSTRTTHPYYMARWNELLGQLGIRAKLHNRYRHQTKGEMAAGCENKPLLMKTAKDTMSCSSPAKARWVKAPPQHCGHCVPCLIRRASLQVGLGSDPTTYTLPDLHARPLDAAKAEGEHIRAFQLAIAQLRTRPSRARFRIHQPGPLNDLPDELLQYEAVYVNGLNEVDALVRGVVVKPMG